MTGRNTGPIERIRRARRGGGLAAGVALTALAGTAASADTMNWALTQAYQNNPQLNYQRA